MSLTLQDIEDFKAGNAALKAARAAKLEEYHATQDEVASAGAALAAATANKETADVLAADALIVYENADKEHDDFNKAFIAKLEADISDNPTGS